MPNMRYCVFENTYRDLRQAFDKLEDGDNDEELGLAEATAKRKLIELCKDIARDYGDGDDE